MEYAPDAIDRIGASAGCCQPALRFGTSIETRTFDRECAVLDLTDAAQAAMRASRCRRRGDIVNGNRFDLLAVELYARADAYRGRTGNTQPR